MPRLKDPRKRVAKVAAGQNGKGDVSPQKRAARQQEVKVVIPPLLQTQMMLTIVGDRPLLLNNKLSVAEAIAGRYQGKGKTASVVLQDRPEAEQYAGAFYVMPDSPYEAPHKKGRYGVPTSGIAKCLRKAIRTTGITDNTTIGLIGKSFFVLADSGGLCLIQHKGFVMDRRPVNIGSGQKTVPNMRVRPLFPDWKIVLKIIFNAKILSEQQIVNLAMHAGQYIGLCELRAEKGQGECGGFVVGTARRNRRGVKAK